MENLRESPKEEPIESQTKIIKESIKEVKKETKQESLSVKKDKPKRLNSSQKSSSIKKSNHVSVNPINTQPNASRHHKSSSQDFSCSITDSPKRTVERIPKTDIKKPSTKFSNKLHRKNK